MANWNSTNVIHSTKWSYYKFLPYWFELEFGRWLTKNVGHLAWSVSDDQDGGHRIARLGWWPENCC